MKVILLAIILLAIFITAMAIFIFVGKRKKFPDTHISHNKEMRKRGITCAQHESMGCKPSSNTDCGSCCGH